jgi:hypothetical protein
MRLPTSPINFTKDIDMIRITPPPAPKFKTVEQQNTDLTAEGSPPPGTVGSAINLTAPPALPAQPKQGKTRTRLGLPKVSAPKLPHERDESINTAGTVPSAAIRQAERDLKRGLVDTDRGAEAGRTYKKLK